MYLLPNHPVQFELQTTSLNELITIQNLEQGM